MMTIRMCWIVALTVGAVIVCTAWSAPLATPLKLSEVASADDITAEVEAKISEIESGLVSPESYQAAKTKLRLSAVQLTVLSQALAEHDEDSKFKSTGALIRNAAVQIGVATSFDQARRGLETLHAGMEDKGKSLANVKYDWAKLAQTRLLMESLRERTDLVRKAMRRSKDAVAESRHAATMAVLALAVAAHAEDVKVEDERPNWRDWSMEFQREMTKTAAALRRQDAPAVLEHFTAAQTACDKCHEKFKR